MKQILEIISIEETSFTNYSYINCLPYPDHDYAKKYYNGDETTTSSVDSQQSEENFVLKSARGRPSMTMIEKFTAEYNRGIKGYISIFFLKVFFLLISL